MSRKGPLIGVEAGGVACRWVIFDLLCCVISITDYCNNYSIAILTSCYIKIWKFCFGTQYFLSRILHIFEPNHTLTIPSMPKYY